MAEEGGGGAARRRRRQLDMASTGEVAAAAEPGKDEKAAEDKNEVEAGAEGKASDAGGGDATARSSASQGGGGRRRRRAESQDAGGADRRPSQASAASGAARSENNDKGSVAGSAGGGGPRSADGRDSARSGSKEEGAGASDKAPSVAGPEEEEEAEEDDDGTGDVMQVTIHGTDELKPHIFLIHPVVQLSILDTEDKGKCVKKKHLNRNVVLQHENATEQDTAAASASTGAAKDAPPSPMKSKAHQRVLPVQTAPYDLSTHLREGKQLKCKWEEAIGLDEDFSFFMNKRFVFMFELMDFIHTTESGEEIDASKINKHGGWKRIAWAFLRPNDEKRKFFRMGEMLRLQLYKYRSFWFWQKPTGVTEEGPWQVYQQWKAGPRAWKPYKSTLFVTVKSIGRPDGRTVSLRALMPWEQEEGSDNSTFARVGNADGQRNQGASEGLDKTRLGKKWIGATGKWCRVPNTCMHKLESDHRGCFVISFSSFGTFLACAVGGRQLYRIKIFNVATGLLAMTLPGHHEIVYDMQWGMEVDDTASDENMGGIMGGNAANTSLPEGERWIPKLLTASADTTAKVWNVERADPLAVCHHPAYVYCARFVPGPEGHRGENAMQLAESASNYVLTGCFDHHLRLWNVSSDAVSETGAAQILKIVTGHGSHINSIAVDATHNKAYSADGVGVIRVWNVMKHSFDSIKEVNEPEVKGDALNCLIVDKTGKRLIMLARDNMIRMLDTDSWKVTQRFSGLRCSNHHIRCDLSPDGRYLMSGSEDGNVLVWNTETGEQDNSVSRDRLPSFNGMCSDVAWNPAERIAAVCSFSRKQPVLIYKYERDSENLAHDEITEEEAREVLQGKFSELAEAFRRIDINGDGKLQLDEFRQGMMSLELDMSDVQILRMFKAAAGDGEEIDRDEFIKRFAPTGAFQKIKTQESIEKARQRRVDAPRQRKAEVLGLLDELDGKPKKSPARKGDADEGSPKKKTLARKNR